MADHVDRTTRSKIMARVKSKGTAPEMKVRRAVHAAGYRYRLHVSELPGKPDLVFPKYKLALFIHGCFWHGHMCENFRMPSTNVDYWTNKIRRNVMRDDENRRKLEALGWTAYVIWECQLEEGIKAFLTMLETTNKTQTRSNSMK